MQETHYSNSFSRYLDGGFLLINSGTDSGKRSYSGVGFLVAPWLRSAVYSFAMHSDRICVLKIRVRGGKFAIINNYSPTNSGYDYSVRQTHFGELRRIYSSVSCYGSKVLLGDFNSRVNKRFPGEEDVLGQHCFGNPSYVQDPDTNRELLMETCAATGLCLANTFFENSPERLVTYHEFAQQPMGPINTSGFAQLDYIAVR